MSLSEFLKDLPTHNRDNFTRIQTDASSLGRPHHGQVSTRSRSTVYVPTKDIPSEQVIVTEKTNILLRYLHQQWDKKAAQAANAQRKREAEGRLHEDEATAGPSGVSQRKKARLDPLPNGSNVGANGSVNMPPSSLIGNSSGIANATYGLGASSAAGTGSLQSSAPPYLHHNYHNSHQSSHHPPLHPQNAHGSSNSQAGPSGSNSGFLQ